MTGLITYLNYVIRVRCAHCDRGGGHWQMRFGDAAGASLVIPRVIPSVQSLSLAYPSRSIQ